MIKIWNFLLFILIFKISFVYADSLNLTKIKKLVEQEETLAYYYKKQLLEKGTILSISEDGVLSYDSLTKMRIINPFSNALINFNGPSQTIEGFNNLSTLDIDSINYYYSNENRKYTKAPLVLRGNKKFIEAPLRKDGNVEIVLSAKEKFIKENKIKKTNTNNEYYLDDKEVLHFYSDDKYRYSYDSELVIPENLKIFCDDISMVGVSKQCTKLGDITKDFKTLTKNTMTLGMTVFRQTGSDNVSKEYVVLGPNNIIQLNQKNRDIGKTIIQFNRRAGGMIVNGDIYAWGNNGNKITGINKGYTGTKMTGTTYPVITGIVPLRAKIYDVKDKDSNVIDFYTQNYFSSPLRPKFIDFFNSVYIGTCGISLKGELYCGGTKGAQISDAYTDLDTVRNGELLYRSTIFNGTTKKAKKIFANNQIFHILGEDGLVYVWGDNSSGFGGNASQSNTFNNNSTIVKLSNIKDITYLLTIGFRRIGAISKTGNIYLWGVEEYNTSTTTKLGACSKKANNSEWANMCEPTVVNNVTSNMQTAINFESLKGGIDAFIAKDVNKKYYKISQRGDTKINVEEISGKIKDTSKFPTYNIVDDAEILSVDLSRTISDLSSLSTPSNGIVWVNGKNELKGDYFTTANKDDNLFKNAIKKIKWKQIKVIQDDNGMCGIDINDQMYCWGIQSFYRDGNSGIDPLGNTFMIPVFNTNLYDLEKDFLVAEGGKGELTNMTSGGFSATNSEGKTGAFFIKYPTYIGGFNYDFEFK